MIHCTLSLLLMILLANSALAGAEYEITSTKGEETVTYTVNFGGGFMFEQYTGYDPVSQKFVYLTWPRDGQVPKPVGVIWDHQTGKTMDLYQFPGVNHPLPVIPSLEVMKVCPRTGDRNFKARPALAYD